MGLIHASISQPNAQYNLRGVTEAVVPVLAINDWALPKEGKCASPLLSVLDGARGTGPECDMGHCASINSKGRVFVEWELTWTRIFPSGAPRCDTVCCGLDFLTFNVLASCSVVDRRGCS